MSVYGIIRHFLRNFVAGPTNGYEQTDGTYALFKYRHEFIKEITDSPDDEIYINQEWEEFLRTLSALDNNQDSSERHSETDESATTG